MGKDKIKVESMWNQEALEKLLYEIQNISYKTGPKKVEKRKKRVTTENAT